jgi:hypothetical protein
MGFIFLSSVALISLNFRNFFNSTGGNELLYIILPFLLVFALVFAIIEKSGLIGNRAAQAIIAGAIGLLSLTNGYLSNFLRTFAPNLAIAISFLLAAVILLGLFASHADQNIKNFIHWALVIVGVVIFIVFVFSSLAEGSFDGSMFWNNYGPSLVVLVLIGLIIWAIVKKGTVKP